MEKSRNLYRMFFPETIAVIGASPNLEKHGGAMLYRAIKYGYPQEAIFPVNPNYEKIFGLPCYKNVKDLPVVPDVVFIIIPVELVADVVKECGEKGVKNVVVISAGFKEVGGEGVEREKKLLEIVNACGINLLGPNCPGFISPKIHFCMTVVDPVKPGGAVLITQSGGLTTAMNELTKELEIGCRLFVGVGNKAQIGEIEILQSFYEDEKLLKDTRVIALHQESLERTNELIETAQKFREKKMPILILKVGKSEAAKKAASSHTGALATSEKASRAVFNKAGLIEVGNLESLLCGALAFEKFSTLSRGGIAVLTNSGGVGALIVDAGLEMVEFSRETKEHLKEILSRHSKWCSVNNPVDIVGGGTPQFFSETMKELLVRPEINTLIIGMTGEPFEGLNLQIARAIADAYKLIKGNNKPVFVVMMAKVLPEFREIFQSAGIPVFNSEEAAAKTLSAMVEYQNLLKKEAGIIIKMVSDIKKAEVAGILRDANGYLPGLKAKEVLEAYGFKFPKSVLLKDRSAANMNCLIFRSSGVREVVLKIESPDVIHKTEIGGVITNVPTYDRQTFLQAYDKIIRSAKTHRVQIIGVLMQEMVKTGKEVLIGAKKEPGIGHLIAFGEGGIYTEARNDIAFALAPLTNVEAADLMLETKFFKILKGVRAERPVSVKMLLEALLRISQLVGDFPEIAELDINPMKVDADNLICVDARIKVER